MAIELTPAQQAVLDYLRAKGPVSSFPEGMLSAATVLQDLIFFGLARRERIEDPATRRETARYSAT